MIDPQKAKIIDLQCEMRDLIPYLTLIVNLDLSKVEVPLLGELLTLEHFQAGRHECDPIRV